MINYDNYIKSINNKSGEAYFKNKWLDKFAKSNTLIKYASELMIGRDRVDLLELDSNSYSRIIEVKSNLDSIANLKSQVYSYYRVTEKVILLIDYDLYMTNKTFISNLPVTVYSLTSNMLEKEMSCSYINDYLCKKTMLSMLNAKMRKDFVLFKNAYTYEEVDKMTALEISNIAKSKWDNLSNIDALQQLNRLLFTYKTYSVDSFDNYNPDMLLYNLHNLQSINK